MYLLDEIYETTQENTSVRRIFPKIRAKMNELYPGSSLDDDWIKVYIIWELSLIKELGFEVNFLNTKVSKNHNNYSIYINDRFIKIPKLLLQQNDKNISKVEIYEALIFNRNLFMQNFITPHQFKFPESRNILENYFL